MSIFWTLVQNYIVMIVLPLGTAGCAAAIALAAVRRNRRDVVTWLLATTFATALLLVSSFLA